jgi:peptidoglycan-associated lipoprotein
MVEMANLGKGERHMNRTLWTCGSVLAMSIVLIGMPGCSKKSVQSGGDSQSTQGGAKGGTDSSKSGVGNFPDTGVQSGGGGLRGLDKNPSEERLGSGTTQGKMDSSSSAGRQMEEIRAEQAASAAAGLRDVFFGYDSWVISEEGRQSLSHDAEWMKSNPNALIKVEGHCDERGTVAYNFVLGEKRAKAARNYLVELGVAANRLSVVSYGKERPSCNEHAESCYQQNRRGRILIKSGK